MNWVVDVCDLLNLSTATKQQLVICHYLDIQIESLQTYLYTDRCRPFMITAGGDGSATSTCASTSMWAVMKRWYPAEIYAEIRARNGGGRMPFYIRKRSGRITQTFHTPPFFALYFQYDYLKWAWQEDAENPSLLHNERLIMLFSLPRICGRLKALALRQLPSTSGGTPGTVRSFGKHYIQQNIMQAS